MAINAWINNFTFIYILPIKNIVLSTIIFILIYLIFLIFLKK